MEAVKVRLRAGDVDIYTTGDAVRAAIVETLALADRTAAEVESLAPGNAVAGLDELRKATAEARGWTATVIENWPKRDRPFLPFGPAERAMAERAYAEFARGEYEYAEDIVARLKAGGPLIK